MRYSALVLLICLTVLLTGCELLDLQPATVCASLTQYSWFYWDIEPGCPAAGPLVFAAGNYFNNVSTETITIGQTGSTTGGPSFSISGGMNPQALRFPPPSMGKQLYVLDNGTIQRIAVLDLQGQKITAQIPLPTSSYAGQQTVFSAEGKFLYLPKTKYRTVVSTPPPSLLVINVASNQIQGEIAFPDPVTPQGGVAITPDGQFLYVPVANAPPGSATITYSVHVINVASNAIAATINLPGDASPTDIKATPDGRTMYVAVQSATSNLGLIAIDILTNTIFANIQFPPLTAISRIAIDPHGRFVYGTSNGPNIVIADTITNKYVSQIKVAPAVSGVSRLAISPDGHFLYSLDQGAPTVYVIDTVSRAVSSQAQVIAFPSNQPGWNLFDIVLPQ
jgi:YVTN family beta-propeller protein